MRHARSRCTGTMSNRRSIENHWLLGARSNRFKLLPGWNSNLQRFRAVIQWQINRIIASPRPQAIRDFRLHMLLVRLSHGHPAPLAFFVASVEIQTTDASRRHMRHCQICRAHQVIDVDSLCISAKLHHHPCRMSTEIPDSVTHNSFGSPRQTIKILLCIVKASTFQSPVLNVVPCRFLRGREQLRPRRNHGECSGTRYQRCSAGKSCRHICSPGGRKCGCCGWIRIRQLVR